MGGAAKALNPGNIFRGAAAAASMGTSELLQKKPFGAFNNPTGMGIFGGTSTDPNASALNLYMDPQGDMNAINDLAQTQFGQSNDLLGKNVGLINDQGSTQYGQTTEQIGKDNAQRQAARDQLATLLQQQAAQTFKQTLPGTAEDYNSGGLLNSTGYQQEVARQQAQLAAQVTNQLGQQGIQDMYTTTGQNDAALAARQAFQNQGLNQQIQGSQTNMGNLQTGNQQALQRGFNLQDYAREANVAKQIGAQTAPSTKPTKASSTAMGLGGIGSGAQAGALMGGPHGAIAGGIGGGLLGILGGGGGK